MIKNPLLCFLATALLTVSGYASAGASMRSCLLEGVKLNNKGYAIQFSSMSGKRLSITAVEGQKKEYLGSLTEPMIQRIHPNYRRLGAAASAAGLVAAGVGLAYVAPYAWAVGGFMAYSEVAAGTLLGYSVTMGPIVAGGAGLVAAGTMIKSINPLEQLDRANIDKCVKVTGQTLKNDAIAVIRLKSKKEYSETVEDLKNLIRSLN